MPPFSFLFLRTLVYNNLIMKLKTFILPILLSTFAISITGCNNQPSSPRFVDADLKDYFDCLKDSNYNFTFESLNEGGHYRKLYSLSPDAFYIQRGRIYREQLYITSQYGMFYIEGQGTQDYIVDADSNVIVEFFEGPGRLENLTESFSSDMEYGMENYFSHVPISTFLNMDLSEFSVVSKEGDTLTYSTQNRQINEMMSYLSNAWYANWDIDTPSDYYLDLNKCTTNAKIENDKLIFEFVSCFQKNIQGLPEDNVYVSTFSVYDPGTTHESVVENYIAHPNPIERKDGYFTDMNAFSKTFGEVAIPFAGEKHGQLLSVTESYSSYSVNIFDSSTSSDIADWFRGELVKSEYNWNYDEEQSQAASERFPYSSEVYAFSKNVTLVESGETSEFKVYFTFTFVPASMLDEGDKALRPNGFFYAEIYRLIDDEAIVGYDNIKDALKNVGSDAYYPLFENVESYHYSMINLIDVSSGVEIDEGMELVVFYQITITGFTHENLLTFLNNWKIEILKMPEYQDVSESEDDFSLTCSANFTESDLIFSASIIGSLENKDTASEQYVIYLIGAAKEA